MAKRLLGGLLGRGLCLEGVGSPGTGEDSQLLLEGPPQRAFFLLMVAIRIDMQAPPRMFKPLLDLPVEQGGDGC